MGHLFYTKKALVSIYVPAPCGTRSKGGAKIVGRVDRYQGLNVQALYPLYTFFESNVKRILIIILAQMRKYEMFIRN